MTQSTTITTAEKVLATTYKRFPVVFTRGDGCCLYDESGKKYVDFIAGIAVCGLGHAHPAVAKAVAEQAATLVHTSNLYYTEPQVKLAEWLTGHSFADRVFFANSGAEANEAAIKTSTKIFQGSGSAGPISHHCHGTVFPRPNPGNPFGHRPGKDS